MHQSMVEPELSAQWPVSEGASLAPWVSVTPAASQDLALCGHFVGESSMTFRGPALFLWTHLLTLNDPMTPGISALQVNREVQ